MRNYIANKVINAVKANVPETAVEKAKSKLNKAIQGTKGTKAKLKQTLFEIKNKLPLTFKKSTKKSESNTERYNRVQKENTKVFKDMINKATENKATGGRVGRKFGSPNPRKSNVQKIKETFGPKKKLSPKQMKIAKLAGNPKKIDAPDFKKLRGRG
jgi:hypothetical protein